MIKTKKKKSSYFDEVFKSKKMQKLYHQEGAILEAQEMVCHLMNEEGVNKAELARRMGCHRSRITKLMSDELEIDLRCLSDMLFALGYQVKIAAVKIK